MRTFEAAAWLRRAGADTSEVKRFFQSEATTFQSKADAIANAEYLDNGVVIATSQGYSTEAQIINAQVADTLLSVKGVRAAIALGKNDMNKTVISARSLGDVNVQMLMERFGGGGTGKAGDIVKVSDGFANNRLIPAGLAVPATNQNVKSAEKQKAFIEKKNAEEKAAAEATAKKLESKTVTIKTRVGDNGKLFGSITSMDIADAIQKQVGNKIDKKKIVLSKPIKEIGEHTVEVKLYPEVSATVKVVIAEE